MIYSFIKFRSEQIFNTCWDAFHSRTYNFLLILIFSETFCRFRRRTSKSSPTSCFPKIPSYPLFFSKKGNNSDYVAKHSFLDLARHQELNKASLVLHCQLYLIFALENILLLPVYVISFLCKCIKVKSYIWPI